MYQWTVIVIASLLAGTARAQTCQPGTGVLKLLQLDTCRDVTPLVQCASKMQLSTSQYCSVQLLPEMKVADDGTYCEISKGVQSRNTATGKYSMGKSDLDIELRSHGGGMVLMLIKGRIVPDAGGRETQVDCNMLYNVTAGTALGITSQGSDTLMSTTYTGPPLPTSGAVQASAANGEFSVNLGPASTASAGGSSMGMYSNYNNGAQGGFGAVVGMDSSLQQQQQQIAPAYPGQQLAPAAALPPYGPASPVPGLSRAGSIRAGSCWVLLGSVLLALLVCFVA